MCYNRWEYDIVKKGLNIKNNGNGDVYEHL